MSSLAKVSVAVLTWNGRQHLATCLAALADQTDPGVPWEILVLDNGSTDGTAAWVQQAHAQDPRLRLIESPVNLGFCAGNNRLVAHASGDAVAFLNNDTRPEPGWLAALAAAYREAPDDVAAVSGKIVDWEGERLDFAKGVMTFDGHAFQLDFRRPLPEARIPAAGEELLFACGGNMLVRKSSFLAAGGFDESYFAYLEDVDLGWRLWSGGERVVFAPGAVVRHRSAATSDLLGLFNRGFLFERNALLTAYKNYEPGLWESLLPAVLLTFLSRSQALLVGNNPGMETLLIDPYAGWIANTAGRGPTARRPELAHRTPWTAARLLGRLRELGPAEFLRRGLARLKPKAPSPAPQLTDERTVAQFRALSNLLGNLERAAASRSRVQARRVRGDREIFARFPLYLVPTYPGDERLFADPGFAAWLPEDLPLVRSTLAEVMAP